MSDPFEGYSQGLNGPVTGALAIVPNDDADLTVIPRGFYCLSGDMRLTFMNGQTVNFKSNTQGDPWTFSFRVKRIHATGTTATNFVLLW